MQSNQEVSKTNGHKVKSSGKNVTGELFSHGEAALGKITAKWQFVSASTAQEWLTKNRQNRKISPARVDKHADQLGRGRFKITGQTIAFDKNGVLIDGQHRLTAIAKSGIGFWFLVVEGLPPVARAATDLGVSRKPAHLLAILGGEERPGPVAAVIKMIQSAVAKSIDAVDWEDLDAARKKYVDGLDWLRGLERPKKTKLSNASIMGALVFAFKKNPSFIQKNYELFQSGVFESKTDPLIALRDFAMQARVTSIEVRNELFYKALTALWHKMEGRKPSKLFATKEAVEYFKAAYSK